MKISLTNKRLLFEILTKNFFLAPAMVGMVGIGKQKKGKSEFSRKKTGHDSHPSCPVFLTKTNLNS